LFKITFLNVSLIVHSKAGLIENSISLYDGHGTIHWPYPYYYSTMIKLPRTTQFTDSFKVHVIHLKAMLIKSRSGYLGKKYLLRISFNAQKKDYIFCVVAKAAFSVLLMISEATYNSMLSLLLNFTSLI